MNVDKSSARVRQMFGEIAGRYDFSTGCCRWASIALAAADRQAGAAGGRCADPRRLHRDGRPGVGLLAGRPRHAGRRHGFLRADAGHRPREMPPGGRRAANHPAGSRHPAAALSRRHVSDRLAWPSGCGTSATPTPGCGRWCGCAGRGAGGRAGVLDAHRLAVGRRLRLVFPARIARIGQALARNSQAAYNYLPQSVGHFPQAEARPSGCSGRVGRNARGGSRSGWQRCTSVENRVQRSGTSALPKSSRKVTRESKCLT